jgi:hypothetical protein
MNMDIAINQLQARGQDIQVISQYSVEKQAGYTSTISTISPKKTCEYEIMYRYH